MFASEAGQVRMDEWDDDDLVASVAVEYVARYGAKAPVYLLDREAISREAGDHLSADAWHDIARAAAEVLRASPQRPAGNLKEQARMTRDMIRALIDHNQLRDKVDADDPAIVPMDTDAEAAGTPTPPGADEVDCEQAARAKRRVPHPDPCRVRANPRQPWRG